MADMNPQKIDSVENQKNPSCNQNKLLTTVQESIGKYLKNFPNPSFAMSHLAKNTGLNKKTIKRLVRSENVPTPKTLLALYREFLQVDSYDELLRNCPPVVRDELKAYNGSSLLKLSQKDQDFLQSLKAEPVKAEIYLMAQVGLVHRQTVTYLYGHYGIDLLEQMAEEGILTQVDRDAYEINKKRLELSAACLCEIGLRASSRFFKANHDTPIADRRNAVYLQAKGLSEKGLQQWLEIDQHAHQAKKEVYNNPENRGTIPAFTFSITEKMTVDDRD